MFRRYLLFCVSVACVVAGVSGCGGGGSSPTPTPRTSPTTGPTQTPDTLVLSPSAISINGAGATYAQTLTVSETAYTGDFSETDTCAGIATISPAGGVGPSLQETLTGVASGSCAVTFLDGHGQKTTANVVVTISSVVVN
jgi:hypothetical protein